MTQTTAPMCLSCRHLDRKVWDLACTAFPEKIPEPILEGLADHREAYEGDHGIRYEHDPQIPPTGLAKLTPEQAKEALEKDEADDEDEEA